MRAVDADLAGIVESCLATEPGARPGAAALRELARLHVPAADPSWPARIAERIELRRTFAATPVGKLETIPPPDESAPEPPGAGDPTSRTRRKPRRRLLVLPVVAVLAVGGVVAYMLVPSVSSAHAGANGSASTSYDAVSVSKTSTLTPSARPSHSASASASASATAPAGIGTEGTTPPSGSGTTSTSGGGGTTTTGGGATTKSVTPVAASSITGVSGNNDPEHVSGSEGDVDYVFNDAACSAWLDNDGTGQLAGVLNTSQYQSCGAELYRSDGIKYKFSQSTGAAKTNYISDQGYTMQICVWDASSPGTVDCGGKFTMSGSTPVEQN
jgi:hypothetical protein